MIRNPDHPGGGPGDVRFSVQTGPMPVETLGAGPVTTMPGMPGGPGTPLMLFWGMNGKSDSEMRKLIELDIRFEHDSHELANEYRIADKDKKDEVKKQLEEVVNKQFESRQKRRALELERLESEMKKIRASIDKRTEARQQIVDRKVNELLGQDDLSF